MSTVKLRVRQAAGLYARRCSPPDKPDGRRVLTGIAHAAAVAPRRMKTPSAPCWLDRQENCLSASRADAFLAGASPVGLTGRKTRRPGLPATVINSSNPSPASCRTPRSTLFPAGQAGRERRSQRNRSCDRGYTTPDENAVRPLPACPAGRPVDRGCQPRSLTVQIRVRQAAGLHGRRCSPPDKPGGRGVLKGIAHATAVTPRRMRTLSVPCRLVRQEDP